MIEIYLYGNYPQETQFSQIGSNIFFPKQSTAKSLFGLILVL
jgi:hypothetical protein